MDRTYFIDVYVRESSVAGVPAHSFVTLVYNSRRRGNSEAHRQGLEWQAYFKGLLIDRPSYSPYLFNEKNKREHGFGVLHPVVDLRPQSEENERSEIC